MGSAAVLIAAKMGCRVLAVTTSKEKVGGEGEGKGRGRISLFNFSLSHSTMSLPIKTTLPPLFNTRTELSKVGAPTHSRTMSTPPEIKRERGGVEKRERERAREKKKKKKGDKAKRCRR